jgi:hypothetical protein
MFFIKCTRASVIAAVLFLLPACGGGGAASTVLPTSVDLSQGAGDSTTFRHRQRQSPSPSASASPSSNPSARPSTSPSPTPSPTPSVTPTSVPPSQSWIWGVTSDDPSVNTAQQVDALSSLPKRVMVRTVFDMPSGGGPVAADYAPSIAMISQVADVMALTNDSSTMAKTSLATIQARIAEYLATLSSNVKVWEIGNEVNGNWLGSGVVPKVEAEYDAVKAAGKSTALTLYYENPPTPGYDMIPWVDANIPVGNRMRAGLDNVLVSYYEDQNGGHQLTQSELNGIFSALAARFPNAKLGFGEFGYGGATPPQTASGNAQRAALLQRFYGYRVPSVPSFVGGGFYWGFRQTMVPKTQPDWTVLDTLL